MLVLCIIGTSLSYGQSQLKKADKLFEEFKFVKALDQYMAAYEKEQSEAAISGIIESYKRMGALNEAESYLQQLVNMPSTRPVYKLYLGQSLLSNGKYQEASEAFKAYAELVPSDSRGKSFLDVAENYNQLNMGDPQMMVEALEMNSPYDDYSPAFYKDGFIFSSDRGGVDANKMYDVTGRPFCDFYFSPSEGDLKHTVSDIWGGSINTEYHEGTCAFSNEGNKVYFTRDNYFKRRLTPSSDDIVQLKLYVAERENEEGKWEIIDEIPFNNDDYSVMHPSLSEDGNALYFASTMPGGYGETDIYVSYRVGSSWGTPENLGPEINSEGRDQFPFIAKDGILFYASDGMAGLGGLDIFKSRLVDGNWASPKNMGAPVNSNADDFGLIMETESRSGYFTSRRAGGSGLDDIYSFRKTDCITLSGTVVDEETGAAVANARIMIQDEDGAVVYENDADANGMFSTCLDAENNYAVTANHENYSNGSTENISTYGMTEKSAAIQINMSNKPKEEVATGSDTSDPDSNEGDGSPTDNMGDGSTPGGSADCTVSGRVFDNATGTGLAGSKVTLQALSGGAQETYSDASGNYSFNVEADMDYKIYSNTTDYYTANLGFKTIAGDCNKNVDLGLDRIEMNKAISLEHIYYDLGSANIRQDAVPELEKLVTLMQENPGITVTLCSHTDSRGNDSANLDLSQRRAQAAVEYIVSRGVDESRITPTGFGESQLLNECADGVACTDAQHQQNRRTEFKITGYDSGILYSESKYFSSDGSTSPSSDIYGSGSSQMFIDK